MNIANTRIIQAQSVSSPAMSQTLDTEQTEFSDPPGILSWNLQTCYYHSGSINRLLLNSYDDVADPRNGIPGRVLTEEEKAEEEKEIFHSDLIDGDTY